MTSFAAISDAIRDKFRDDVATPNSLTVIYDNAPSQDLKQKWYRLSVLFDSTTMIHTGGVGDRRYRIMGRAVLNLFEPVSTGDDALLDIVDLVNTAFRSQSITSPSVVFRNPPSLTGVAERDASWFRRTMTIPFEADVFG